MPEKFARVIDCSQGLSRYRIGDTVFSWQLSGYVENICEEINAAHEKALEEARKSALEERIQMIRCERPDDILLVDNTYMAEQFVIHARDGRLCGHSHPIVIGKAGFRALKDGKAVD